jgi:hypothetical protein
MTVESGKHARHALAALLLLSASLLAVEAVRYALAAGGRGRFHVEGPAFMFALVCILVARTGGGRRPRPVTVLGTGSHRGPTGLPRWSLVASVAAGLLLYAPAFGLGFLSDDFVLRERALHGAAFAWPGTPYWRPLPILVFGVFAAGPIHILNVALHGVNAWLAARLARSLGANEHVALSAGALFLTCPVSGEAVAWCSGLQDVLLTTLAVAFVLSWRAPLRLVARASLACLLLAVAMLTKETAVALPLLALVAWVRMPLPP